MSRRALLIELLGPVLGHPQAMRRTLLEFVGGLGLAPRPGALDGVHGGTAGWVLETLLEGHGRDAVPDAAAALARAWARTASRDLAVHPGVLERLEGFAASGHAVGLLSVLPPDAVPAPLHRFLVADSDVDGAGAPRPGAVRAWLAAHDLEGADATAVVASPAALLAVSAARVGRVLCHGDAPGLAALPSDGAIASLADLGDRLD